MLYERTHRNITDGDQHLSNTNQLTRFVLLCSAQQLGARTHSAQHQIQLNKGADTDTTRPLQRECRHTLPALNNIVPGMMSVAISLFIATVSTLAFLILRPYLWGVSLAVYLFAAFVAFLLIYITFTLFLLITGYGIARRLQIEIDEKFGSRA